MPEVDGIVIDLSATTEGLESAIDQYERLSDADKKLLDALNKSNSAHAARVKILEQEVSTGKATTKANEDRAKSVENLSNKFKLLNDTIANGALNKISNDVLKQLQVDLNNSAISAEEFGKKLSDAVTKTDAPGKSLRQQLRGMKEELSQLEIQGKENSDQFINLAVTAAKLEDQLGDTAQRVRFLADDSKNIKTVVEAVQGVAASFSVISGTQALFGDESEGLQKTLVKLNATIALLNGITQINTIIQKESIVYQRIASLQRKAATVSVQLETAAESGNIVVKYAAIVAQKALNAVMAASPAGILLTIFAGLAASLVYFSQSADDSAKALTKLNEQEAAEINNLKQINDLINTVAQARIKQREQDLALAKAQNKSNEEQATIEKDLLQLRLEAATSDFKRNEAYISQLDRVKGQLEGAKSALVTLNATGKNEELVKQKEAEIKANQAFFDSFQPILDAYKSATQASKEFNASAEVVATTRSLQLSKDAADKRVAIAKEGSQEELAARIAALKAAAAIQLNDPNLSADARIRIEKETEKSISDLQSANRIKLLQDERSAIIAKQAIVKEGSAGELAIKQQLIQNQEQIDLEGARHNVAKRKEIIAQAAKDELELNKRFTFEQLQAASRFTINGIKEKLVQVQSGSVQELEIQKQLIDAEAKQQATAAIDTIKNERELTSQLTLIDAEQIKKKFELQKAFDIKQYDDALTLNNQLIDLENARLSAEASSSETSIGRRKEIAAIILQNQLAENKAESEANTNKFVDFLITEKDYNEKKVQLAKDRISIISQLENTAAAEQRALVKSIIDFEANALSQISSFNTQITQDGIAENEQAQLDSITKRKEQELNNKNLTEAQKAKIDEKYRKEEAKIKTEAAIKQREAESLQAEINGLLAVTSILSNSAAYGGPFGVGLAIAAAELTTGLQIAAIKSKPIPKYHTGVEMVEGAHDEVLALLKRKERVVPEDINMAYFPALSAIQNRKVTPQVANKLLSSESLAMRNDRYMDATASRAHFISNEDMSRMMIGRDTNVEKLAHEINRILIDVIKRSDDKHSKTQRAFDERLNALTQAVKERNAYDPRRT